MPNILVTTLGGSWQIIPELLAFTNPDCMDLYRNHPRLADIERTRTHYAIAPVDEIRVVTTRGEIADRSVSCLKSWRSCIQGPCPVLRIWQVADAEDLASEAECRRMHETILRIVLDASEHIGGGRLLLSLAGGRKTMSSDIQYAATLFGCHALLHVVDNGKHSGKLRDCSPEQFAGPLPADLYDAVTPLVVGQYDRNPVMDLSASGFKPIRAASYWLEPAMDQQEALMTIGDNLALTNDVETRLSKSRFLLYNYTTTMLSGKSASNFLALYSMPPRIIERLKSIRFGIRPDRCAEELAFLKQLPKTDLHCHLGGIADAAELIDIASANQEHIFPYRNLLADWLAPVKEMIGARDAHRIRHQFLDVSQTGTPDFKSIRSAVPAVPEPFCTAAFILAFKDHPSLLDEVIFGPYVNETQFVGAGFDPYEHLGDLQGSGLLQTEESIRAACRILAQKARNHNLRYLELRCSPANYTRGGLSADQVVRIICDELKKSSSDMACSLLIIASRHGNMKRVTDHIKLAQRLLAQAKTHDICLTGFDLAGNEQSRKASDMRAAFMPLMHQCMHFTIHAGEDAPVESIWEAVYHLSAERIGHGLTLKQNPALMKKFKDRNIALEMCPSSNMQIKGFQDSYLKQTQHLDTYPLKDYLNEGLRVTVNTDNPGISRTDFTRELHRAARMTPGGLSLWEIFQIIRNGFKVAFTERDIRQQLLLRAETDILALIQDYFSNEGTQR